MKKQAKKTGLSRIKVAEAFFDESIQIKDIIFLAALSDHSHETLTEWLEMWPQQMGALLGAEVPEDEDDFETYLSRCFCRGKMGYLVCATTPVPRDFYPSGGFSYSWGCCQFEFFYFDQWDESVVVHTLSEWRNQVIERERQKQAKAA
jgi:hypothetical protein